MSIYLDDSKTLFLFVNANNSSDVGNGLSLYWVFNAFICCSFNYPPLYFLDLRFTILYFLLLTIYYINKK